MAILSAKCLSRQMKTLNLIQNRTFLLTVKISLAWVKNVECQKQQEATENRYYFSHLSYRKWYFIDVLFHLLQSIKLIADSFLQEDW